MANLGTGVFTPAGFADAMKTFGKDLAKPIVNSIRRGLHRARNRAGAEFRLRGIGHTVWGGKRGKVTVRAYYKRTGVKHKGESFVGGLIAKGLPALQETGGRTKRHVIEPKNAKALVWAGPDGVHGAARVNHPGGRLPALPVLKRAIEAEAPSISVELDANIQKLINTGKAEA